MFHTITYYKRTVCVVLVSRSGMSVICYTADRASLEDSLQRMAHQWGDVIAKYLALRKIATRARTTFNSNTITNSSPIRIIRCVLDGVGAVSVELEACGAAVGKFLSD